MSATVARHLALLNVVWSYSTCWLLSNVKGSYFAYATGPELTHFHTTILFTVFTCKSKTYHLTVRETDTVRYPCMLCVYRGICYWLTIGDSLNWLLFCTGNCQSRCMLKVANAASFQSMPSIQVNHLCWLLPSYKCYRAISSRTSPLRYPPPKSFPQGRLRCCLASCCIPDRLTETLYYVSHIIIIIVTMVIIIVIIATFSVWTYVLLFQLELTRSLPGRS